MLRKLEQRRKERAEMEAKKQNQKTQVYQHVVFKGDEPVEKSSRKQNKRRKRRKRRKIQLNNYLYYI